MSATPWVKWFSGDFLNGVADLEADEGWVYVIALNLIYDRGGPIPFEPDRLARRCRLRKNVVERVVRQLVDAGKLTLEDGKLSNPKAERMLEGRLKTVGNSSRAARVRWEKDRENNGSDDATAMPSQCDRNAILEARSQKLENNPLPPAGGKKSRRKPETALPDDFPDLKALQDAKAKVLASGAAVRITSEAEKFRNHAAQNDRRARDWPAAWRNWILNAIERAPQIGLVASRPTGDDHDPWPYRMRVWANQEGWNDVDWGPEPGQPGCRVPAQHLPPAAE